MVLHPGDFYFTGEAIRIHTLLGSCVSITLWHPQLRVGGMCHFILPRNPDSRRQDHGLDGRYAEDVIEMFKREARRYSTQLKQYQAKIFGGGNMFLSNTQPVDERVGAKNAAAAMQLLLRENVNVLVAHVGEFGHRRIVFDNATGDVWVRHTDSRCASIRSINGVV